jgi:hypothetical protein
MSELSSANEKLACESIEGIVSHRVRLNPYFRRSTLRFDFDGGLLTVRGRVPSYYHKQLIQTIVKEIEGVERVDNCVDVCG